MTSLVCKAFWKTKLKYCADSVEAVPVQLRRELGVPTANLLVVGTYELVKKTQRKLGSLHLFSLERDTDSEQEFTVRELCSYELASALFDAKWCPSTEAGAVLAVADAAGAVNFIALQRRKDKWRFVPLLSFPVPFNNAPVSQETLEPSLLNLSRFAAVEEKAEVTAPAALHFDWARTHADTHSTLLVVSLSNGRVSLLQCAFTATRVHCTELGQWKAHELEVWTAVVHNMCSEETRKDLAARLECRTCEVVWSGSDDTTLKAWAVPSTKAAPTAPLLLCTVTAHTMGVCSLAFHPTHSDWLLSGSYDESVRLWDLRTAYARQGAACKGPTLLHSIKLGSGVWRLKWRPTPEEAQEKTDTTNSFAVAAAMDAGFAVLSVDSRHAKLALCSQHKEHASLAYGCDWLDRVVVSCAFYDRSVHAWRAGC